MKAKTARKIKKYTTSVVIILAVAMMLLSMVGYLI